MLEALTDTVLQLLVLLDLSFMAGLLFIIVGLVRDWWDGNADRLSVALLILCIILAMERLWWVETFLRFSLDFPASERRLINLFLYLIIMALADAAGLYLTWRLYRDD